MHQTLNAAKPKTTSKTIKLSGPYGQSFNILGAGLAFAHFLSDRVVEIHLPGRDSAWVDNFGNVHGNPTYISIVSLNSGISSVVVAAYIVMIILSVIGIVNLSLRYKYKCLLFSLILFTLSLINLSLIASVAVQRAPATSITFDLQEIVIQQGFNILLVSQMVRTVIELKKSHKPLDNNDGANYEFNS